MYASEIREKATLSLLRCMASGNELSRALETVLQRTSLDELRRMFSIWIPWLVNYGSKCVLHHLYVAYSDNRCLGVIHYPGFYWHLMSDVAPRCSATHIVLHKLPLAGILPAVLRFFATLMRSHEDARLALLDAKIFTLLLAIVDGEVRGGLEDRVPPPPFTELSLEQVIDEASELVDEIPTSKKAPRNWGSLRDVVHATAEDGSNVCCDAYESAREVFLQLCGE